MRAEYGKKMGKDKAGRGGGREPRAQGATGGNIRQSDATFDGENVQSGTPDRCIDLPFFSSSSSSFFCYTSKIKREILPSSTVFFFASREERT